MVSHRGRPSQALEECEHLISEPAEPSRQECCCRAPTVDLRCQHLASFHQQ